MKRLLNTLYVLTSDSYISKQGETVCVHVGGKEKVRVPVHTIESIVCFGNTTVSTPLLSFCGKKGVGLSFVNEYGRFYGRLEGEVRGNVLLRRAQYLASEDHDKSSSLVFWFLVAKIANSRNTLLRAARDMIEPASSKALSAAATRLSEVAKGMNGINDIGSLRGMEGLAASIYFDVFEHMIRVNKEDFVFKGRSKRPPLDRVNALLSFLYVLLVNDVRSALESVGLDPYAGFLHALRPGRPSLALDLIEELRSPLCDRLALALINLRQIQAEHFRQSPAGVYLSSEGKKTVLTAWQKRKREEIIHPYINEKIAIGLIPYVQSQLLARYLRGELEQYPPFYWR